MIRSRILTLAAAVLAVVAMWATLWAMYAPIPASSREQLFEIPAGFTAKKMGQPQ